MPRHTLACANLVCADWVNSLEIPPLCRNSLPQSVSPCVAYLGMPRRCTHAGAHSSAILHHIDERWLRTPRLEVLNALHNFEGCVFCFRSKGRARISRPGAFCLVLTLMAAREAAARTKCASVGAHLCGALQLLIVEWVVVVRCARDIVHLLDLGARH